MPSKSKFRYKKYSPPTAPTTSVHLRLPVYLRDWYRRESARDCRTATSLMIKALFDWAERQQAAETNTDNTDSTDSTDKEKP